MANKVFLDGSHRSKLPEQTLEAICGFFPAFGITRIGNITGLDKIGIPTATAFRPNSKSLSVTQGKGTSIAAAKVSAVMESIETYHAENIFLPGLLISYEDLEISYNTIDIENINRRAGRSFNGSEKLFWLLGYDLLNEQSLYLPYNSVSTDFTEHLENAYFLSCSTGLASGNTLLEAQIHGLCEVIERDALALFWSANAEYQSKRRVDINTITDASCVRLLQQIEDAQIECGIWDLTTDIGIPTYLCKIAEDHKNTEAACRPAFGSGTHLNQGVALSRAITEAAQSRATFIAGARDDQYKSIYTHFLDNSQIDAWREEINSFSGFRNYSDTKALDTDSFADDLNIILTNLSKVGISQVVSVDLTKAEFEIPVCKVVVPGLEDINASEVRSVGKRFNRMHN